MEVKLEVVLSSSIKRKKPWPRFCWLGQEKESVFLLDDKRISEINLASGRTKKKTPKLHPLLSGVVTMAASANGVWLCGLLSSGALFLWNRDKDLLKSAESVPEVADMIGGLQGNATRPTVQVSGEGKRALVVAASGQVFLWECSDRRDLMEPRDGTVKGRWTNILPLQDTILPPPQSKEASRHTVFVKSEAVGDACLSVFVFTCGKKLAITCLNIQWEEGLVTPGSVGYSVRWASKTYCMSRLSPACQPVKSRGSLVPAFSPDGQLLAIVLNQRQPQATQVLFVSVQNFVSVTSGLGGCGCKKTEIPAKYIRSYWVAGVSWSPDGLFLACVLKRGSLLVLARLGGLLTLTSTGCNIVFGPAHFLPLHPLVTYRPPLSGGTADASLSSSAVSVRDVMRQRYSVTWHPQLLYLIVSDGYMATVLRVLGRPSPASMLKSQLKDISKDIEKVGRTLDKSQIHARMGSYSVSRQNLDSSLEEFSSYLARVPNTTDSVISAATDGPALPPFLQDQGTFGGTKELFEKVQSLFEEDSDVDGPPIGSHAEDSGRLEYASMFDTLHALDTHADVSAVPAPDDEEFETDRSAQALRRDLGKIQSRLLTAWAFSLSPGSGVENRALLMRCVVHCAARFAASLAGIPDGRKRSSSVSARLLRFLKGLLSFLPWDGAGSDRPHCLGLTAELSRQLVGLLLSAQPDPFQPARCHLSSHNLSTAVLVLELASDSLDRTYSLQQRSAWSSAETEPPSQRCGPSDVYSTPLMQDETEGTFVAGRDGAPFPQRPSSRLLGTWQRVYELSLQHREELKGLQGCDGWQEERQRASAVISRIQKALQAAGGKLEEGPMLLGHPGEHLFLCGLYAESADAWRSQLWEETKKNGRRSVFQQTRLCLALLYGLLAQYRLREAQELGDQAARLLLQRAGIKKDSAASAPDDPPPWSWLPPDLHADAARALIQTLGRFMASYFTNRPLHILPPHNVAVLPPIHLPPASNVGRLVSLCQEEVAGAVRRRHMSELWTADYAMDLLLLGGLLPETAWLAYHLGDWKTAAALSLAYASYRTHHFDFTRINRRELHLPKALEPESIFQAELQRRLDFQETGDDGSDRSTADTLEGDDWDWIQASTQDIVKAAAMAGVDVVSSPLSSLLSAARDLCSALPALVHGGLYLPSPPLYCPQPSPNTQDRVGTAGELAEVASRHKVSGVLQRLLLLLRSARCCRPAARWYVSQLRRARRLLHKIKKRYDHCSAAAEEKALPEGLKKLVDRGGFFGQGRDENARPDPETVHVLVCFREICALCWMLHVRDQLSMSCRKYQAARNRGRDERSSHHADVHSARVDALHWTRRLLPFSHYLNAEEILQDLLLSLLSELPPVPLVADSLVLAFPQEDDSVRVSLREKYSSLLQRLQRRDVQEGQQGEANESMAGVIQDKRRRRRKHLGRLQKHFAAPELHLWEQEEEDEDGGRDHGTAAMLQPSPCTTLSSGALTDLDQPCSDGDAVENSSEGVSPDLRGRSLPRVTKPPASDRAGGKRAEARQPPSLPVVGTWEFELEDEEYLGFLELFLSYVLEKGGTDGEDSAREAPLLRSFCRRLREAELHSLTFDVLTTVHRRERDGQRPARKRGSDDSPLFRAGSCYKPAKLDSASNFQASAAWNEGSVSDASPSAPSLREPGAGRHGGLFGLRRQDARLSQKTPERGRSGSDGQIPPAAFPAECRSFAEAAVEPQRVLDPELEARFPELGRLLEWMLRWADRRAGLGRRGKKKKPTAEGRAEEGVAIRVRASAPAVLTSLCLLERRLFAGTVAEKPDAPVSAAALLLPEQDRKLERESSEDTADIHPAGLAQPSSSSDTDEPEETMSHATPLPDTPDVSSLGDQRSPPRSPPSSEGPRFADLDVTPEKEGASSRGESPEVSDEKVPENTCAPDAANIDTRSQVGPGVIAPTHSTDSSSLQSVKTDDLDTTGFPSICSHASSLPALPPPEPQAPPSVQPRATAHKELPDFPGVSSSDTPAGPPGPRPQSLEADAPGAVPPPVPEQPPPMRQRLGEDLFRLVQHINYMSLMEVLGDSFSTLQQAQQGTCVPQTPPSQANALPGHAGVSMATQTQPCIQNSESKAPPGGSAGRQHSGSLTPAAHGAGARHQELQPLSVQAESPGVEFRERRGLIPSCQGLLAMTDDSRRVHSAPESLPPRGMQIQSDLPSQAPGLKLLQLHGWQGPPPPPLVGESQQRRVRLRGRVDSNEKKTGGSSASRRHLGFEARDRHLRTPGPKDQTWDRSRQTEPSPPPPPSATRGLSLLHFRPPENTHVTFPRLAMPSSRPLCVVAPMAERPSIKLLHLDSKPRPMLPRAPSPAPAAHLMSVAELTGSMRNAEEARLQLLRVNPPLKNQKTVPASPGCTSSKRQKRREKAGRRQGVAFRPEESIIPTQQEPEQEPIGAEPKEAKEAKEEALPGPDVPLKLESFDSSLTGQRLLAKATSTSAELHAFASTCKKPPERHDAFTNTDPAGAPTLVDKAVSASAPEAPGSPPPRDPSSVQLWKDTPDPDGVQPAEQQEMKSLDQLGRHFLSVLDLEGGTRHRDLPPTSKTTSAPAVSSAELHLLATSVIRGSQPAADPSPRVAIPACLTAPVAPPVHSGQSDPGPDLEPEPVFPLDRADPSPSEICKAVKAQSAGVPRPSATPPAVWFSSRLSELDAQLVALQKIADSLEKDFADSRMLVDTVETLTPEVKTAAAVKKTVRLFVPQEEPPPQFEVIAEEDAEDYYQDLDESRPEMTSRHVTSSPVHRAAPPSLHFPPRTKPELNEASETSLWEEEEDLGQAELSDTAELLDGLVKEGYLSLTEAEMSSLLTASLDSSGLEMGQMSKKRSLPEDERKELRVWMRRKQRERLAVYHKHRESLRERERQPFSSPKPAAENQAAFQRTTEEDKKAALLESFSQRAREAHHLAEDVRSWPAARPRTTLAKGPPAAPAARPASAPPPGSAHRVSSDRRTQSVQTQSHQRPWTAETRERSSEDHRRRLGLHRPVTSLPKDRMCQITRRGMITNPKTSSHERHVGKQRAASSSRGPFGTRGGTREPTDAKEERAAGSPSLETTPGLTASDLVLAELLDTQSGPARMDWLDDLSDGSSNLSKIDWDAIERMVAADDV